MGGGAEIGALFCLLRRQHSTDRCRRVKCAFPLVSKGMETGALRLTPPWARAPWHRTELTWVEFSTTNKNMSSNNIVSRYNELVGETGAQTNTGHVETWGFCIVAFERDWCVSFPTSRVCVAWWFENSRVINKSIFSTWKYFYFYFFSPKFFPINRWCVNATDSNHVGYIINGLL